MRFEDYTQEERIEMILNDFDSYARLLTDEHWQMLLDGLGKVKPLGDDVG